MMNKKKTAVARQRNAPLTADELQQIKGGFRAIPGTIERFQMARWDEIGLRIQDDTATFGQNNPGVVKLGLGGILTERRP
ncbi:MAG: hypothetical protein DA408_11195 [Bacteroidetes bacterium]|nr:MAG: hypothetical protein C7N36_15590 [Bacteroidota bacterium]PTM12333.1 MAG: hypothetical protein DA408_11195 [Bacteroidota bacterium]